MERPCWFGNRYPSFEDLEAFAASLHIGIGYATIPIGLYCPDVLGVQVIVLPAEACPLEMIWNLAHELGHAVQHSGPKGERSYGKEEAQANLWAAQALIPESRVMDYRNASQDAFIGALSAHYEDIPLKACPLRELAAKIALHRLRAIKEDVA